MQPQGAPTTLLAGRPQQQHIIRALMFLVSPSTSTSRAERRHRCARMAVRMFIPSCPFAGTTLTIARCYFYARPASAGTWQAAALALLPSLTICSRTISKPLLYTGATTHSFRSQGSFDWSKRAPRSLLKLPSMHKNLFPS